MWVVYLSMKAKKEPKQKTLVVLNANIKHKQLSFCLHQISNQQVK